MGKQRTPLKQQQIAWALAAARQAREEETSLSDYARAKAARRPWLTTQEAAYELDLTPGRITQLATEGKLRTKRKPENRLYVRISAEDVYAYKPRKKTSHKRKTTP